MCFRPGLVRTNGPPSAEPVEACEIIERILPARLCRVCQFLAQDPEASSDERFDEGLMVRGLF